MVYKVITIMPSKTSPSAKAPKQEIVIKAFSLMPLPLSNNLMALIVVL